MMFAKTDSSNLAFKNEGDKRTPLQITCVPGYTDIALLIAMDTDLPALTTVDASGSTALHVAVRNSHLEIVCHLCALLPPSALALPDLDNRTPLHYAVMTIASGPRNDQRSTNKRSTNQANVYVWLASWHQQAAQGNGGPSSSSALRLPLYKD